MLNTPTMDGLLVQEIFVARLNVRLTGDRSVEVFLSFTALVLYGARAF